MTAVESDVTRLVNSYLETGLWLESCRGSEGYDSDHEHNTPLPEDCDVSLQDLGYGADDVSDDARDAATEDCEAFLMSIHEERPETLEHLTVEQIGYNFWLTRNAHGAGFWDLGLPGDLGQWLTDMSRPYGSTYMWVSDGVVELNG